jgi:glycosyltransferase involved in cell wall biosynthesis
MKEVLHCITTICRGGAETQLLTLVRAQIESGRKVSIIYLKDAPELGEDLMKIGANLVDIAAGKNPIIQVLSLRKYLRGKDVIVHAHLPRAELITALSIQKQRFIISKHNAETFFPKAPSFISRRVARLVSRRADACIAISKAVSKFLVEKEEIVADIEPKIIYYGYDPRNFDKIQLNSTKVLAGFKNTETYIIGTIARLTEQKDFPTLLRAFALLNSTIPNSCLWIVGDGVLKDSLMKLSEELEIDKYVKWFGRTSDVFAFLKDVDVFVLASKYEGFGLVLLEALEARIPIIAANNSAIPEVLGKDYENLFPTGEVDVLGDCLIRLSDGHNRIRAIKHGDKQLKKFSPEIMQQKIDNVYENRI